MQRCSYDDAEQLQQQAWAAVLSDPLHAPRILAFCLDPVFTFGRHASPAHLLLSEGELQKRRVSIAKSDRGGEVTYHGPEQLVLYPIVHLETHQLTVKGFVALLEQVMGDFLRSCGLQPRWVANIPGVFVGPAKIGFLGLRIKQGISTHGLSLNLGGDLSPFSWINPCGHPELAITSIEQQTGVRPPHESAAAAIADLLLRQLVAR